MGVNFEKVALAFGALAFQLHIISMAMSNYRVLGPRDEDKSKDDAIQAFIILAYLILTGSFILLLLQNFTGLNGKLIAFFTILTLLAGGVCAVIGVAVYADVINSRNLGTASDVIAFSMTSYIVGAASAAVAAIFLFLRMCCGK